MPIEFVKLKEKEPALDKCPKCGYRHPMFLRGLVQSELRKFFRMAYCAVICDSCKRLVGWEKP